MRNGRNKGYPGRAADAAHGIDEQERPAILCLSFPTSSRLFSVLLHTYIWNAFNIKSGSPLFLTVAVVHRHHEEAIDRSVLERIISLVSERYHLEKEHAHVVFSKYMQALCDLLLSVIRSLRSRSSVQQHDGFPIDWRTIARVELGLGPTFFLRDSALPFFVTPCSLICVVCFVSH